jgi:hypothetical protein
MFILAVSILVGSALAQTAVTATVNSTYSNITAGKPIVPDFTGLGFEAAAERSGNARVSGYFFTPSNAQLITLFQQMGVRNIRLGGGTADLCGTPIPQFYDPPASTGAPDINNAFEFARIAGVQVIYTLRMTNRSRCFVPNLAAQDAQYARFIWNHYRANLEAFSFSNETDFHSAHSFCKTAGQCTCPYGHGCTGNTSDIVTEDPLIYETAVPGGRPVAGTAFPSYLADWISFAKTLRNSATGVPDAPLAGPDSGDYTGGGTNFSGSVPACVNRNFAMTSGWTRMLAACESGADGLTLPTQHYYAGASFSATVAGVVYALTAQEAIGNMLSPQWVNDDLVTTEPYQPAGIPSASKLTYTGYPWLNKTIPPGTRMTELNDYLGGVQGASNSFASALWALDIMHWWALRGAAGVNFHNNQWIPTDTVVPGNLTSYGTGSKLACTTAGVRAPCDNFVINPKGYGIKTFDLGGHGYPLSLDLHPSAAPREFNLSGYAVASGQDLYITLINKTLGTDAGDNASVTIVAAGLPFTAASVSSILLWDGVAGDPSRMSATLGGGSILNTGAQWSGVWTPQKPDSRGGVTLSVHAATAVIVRFHAASHYAGPLQMNQNGALELFATDNSGHLWHNWQKSGQLNAEPNSAAANWGHWTELLSGSSGAVRLTGDLAVAKNLDNTLEIFAISGNGSKTEAVYNQQESPGGAWKGWTAMGSDSAGLMHLQAGQNADGGLSLFALDSSGNLWTATENAPGVAWSNWRELGGTAIQPGYAVAQNLNGRLQVFGVDGSRKLWCIGQTVDNTWSNWHELEAPGGHLLDAQLQVVRNRKGGLTVFSLNSSGNLLTLAQSSPGGGWSKWSKLPVPATRIQPGFVAGENADGSFELFAVGSNGSVYRLKNYPGGGWDGWTALGSPSGGLNSNLVVGNTNDGRLQLFGIAKGVSNAVWSNWQSNPGGSWQKKWISFGGGGLYWSPAKDGKNAIPNQSAIPPTRPSGEG